MKRQIKRHHWFEINPDTDKWIISRENYEAKFAERLSGQGFRKRSKRFGFCTVASGIRMGSSMRLSLFGFVRMHQPFFVENIEFNAHVKIDREKFDEDVVNPFWYSIEYYRPFLLRTIQSKGECGTIVKCHAETHIREMRVLDFWETRPRGNPSLM